MKEEKLTSIEDWEGCEGKVPIEEEWNPIRPDWFPKDAFEAGVAFARNCGREWRKAGLEFTVELLKEIVNYGGNPCADCPLGDSDAGGDESCPVYRKFEVDRIESEMNDFLHLEEDYFPIEDVELAKRIAMENFDRVRELVLDLAFLKGKVGNKDRWIEEAIDSLVGYQSLLVEIYRGNLIWK